MKILLSNPQHFDVNYSINPWMHPGEGIDKKQAIKQWKSLVKKIEELGAELEIAEAGPEVPDFVFAANAGMVIGNKAIVSNFRDPERQPETKYYKEWFESKGYDVTTLPPNIVWEGEACTFPVAGKLLCSYGLRADIEAYEYINEVFEVTKEQCVFTKIIDPYFYHLDVCFCPLDQDTAMYCEMAFTGKVNDWLKSNVKNLISVSYDEALNFTCNALVLGRNIIVNKGISLDLKQELLRSNFIPVELPIHQYIKAGGGIKCTSLHLDRWQKL